MKSQRQSIYCMSWWYINVIVSSHHHSNRSCYVRDALDALNALVEIRIYQKWLQMSFAFIARVSLLLACTFSGYMFTYGTDKSQFHYKSFTTLPNFRMKPDSSTIKSLVVKSSSECSLECTKYSDCMSYNIGKHTTRGSTVKCELLNVDLPHQPIDYLEGNSKFNYFTLQVGFSFCVCGAGIVCSIDNGFSLEYIEAMSPLRHFARCPRPLVHLSPFPRRTFGLLWYSEYLIKSRTDGSIL